MLANDRIAQREDLIITADPSDEMLVRRGDAVAFEQLYERYVDAVYRYCRLRLPTDADAEDATATIFERAFAAFPPKATGSFRAWLFTIAHNTIVSTWRSTAKSRRDRTLNDELPVIDPGPTPEESLLGDEERRQLTTALARLANDQRRVIELRLAGLNGSEIAAVLDRSPAAMRQLQYRAVQQLRRLLSTEGYDDE